MIQQIYAALCLIGLGSALVMSLSAEVCADILDSEALAPWSSSRGDEEMAAAGHILAILQKLSSEETELSHHEVGELLRILRDDKGDPEILYGKEMLRASEVLGEVFRHQPHEVYFIFREVPNGPVAIIPANLRVFPPPDEDPSPEVMATWSVGRGVYSERIATQWVEERLRIEGQALEEFRGAISVSFVGLGGKLRKEPRLRIRYIQGDEIKERELTHLEQIKNAPIIDKIIKANQEENLEPVLVKLPNLSDADKLAILKEIPKTEVWFFPGLFLIAGSESAYQDNRLGNLVFEGGALLAEMSIEQIAYRHVQRHLQRTLPNSWHEAFEHGDVHLAEVHTILVNNAESVAIEQREAKAFAARIVNRLLADAGVVAKEVYLETVLPRGGTRRPQQAPMERDFLLLEKGSQSPGKRQIYQHLPGVSSPSLREDLVKEDQRERGSRRLLLGARMFPAQNVGLRGALQRKETNAQENLQHKGSISYQPGDRIVLVYEDIIAVLDAEQWHERFPDSILDNYDFERHGKPLKIFVVPQDILKTNATLQVALRDVSDETIFGTPHELGSEDGEFDFLPNEASRDQARQYTQLLDRIIRWEKPMVSVQQDGLVFYFGPQTSRETETFDAPELAAIYRLAGLTEIPIREQAGASREAISNHLKWVVDAGKIAKADGFINGRFEETKTAWDVALNLRSEAIRPREVNVKAVTLDQIEQNFADPATKALMLKERRMGVRYLVLTELDRDADGNRVGIRLAIGNIVDPAWIYNSATKEGFIHIMPAIENNAIDINEVVEKFKAELAEALDTAITEEVWKPFMKQTADKNEVTNFVAAFNRNLKVRGDIHAVRHFIVDADVRFSEVLTVLQGLFTMTFPEIIRKHRKSLLAVGYTDQELGQIRHTPGAFLIPPGTLAPLLENLTTRKRADTIVNWQV